MKLYTLGDIHGDFNWLKNHIIDHKMSNCSIIQVGDFGIGFGHRISDEKILIGLNDFFKTRSINFYAIRGNHDNPFFFKGNHKYSNLQLLEDYSILNINDRKILLVGGAISIDRIPRIRQGINSTVEYYWIDEKFTLDEPKLESIKGINTLISHTAPDWCWPDNKNGFGSFVDGWIRIDPSLFVDLNEERKDVTKMFDILTGPSLFPNNNIDTIYYGHFHKSKVSTKNETTAYLLNIGEFMELI